MLDVFDDAALAGTLHAGMRHFYRLLADASPGAHLVERDGVAACVVPVSPERSYPNAVLYDHARALADAYPELERAYADAGVRAWTVWVPEQDLEAVRLLERRGHLLDATPAIMARELAGVERPPPGTLEDWTSEGDPVVLGDLNDRAFGFGDDSLVRVFGGLAAPDLRVYIGSVGGEPVTGLVTTELNGNCEVDCVATPPEARGRGLSGQLLAHALGDAAQRGCTTTTLVATALGRPVYERLGYRSLGVLPMWERRSRGAA